MRVPNLAISSFALGVCLAAPSTVLASSPSKIPEARRKLAVGLAAGGFSLLGSGYLASVVFGGLSASTVSDSWAGDTRRNDYQAFGTLMFVPVMGPFMAIPQRSATDARVAAGLLGVAQAAGLGLGIAGALMLKWQREDDRLRSNGVSLQLGPGSVGLRGSF